MNYFYSLRILYTTLLFSALSTSLSASQLSSLFPYRKISPLKIKLALSDNNNFQTPLYQLDKEKVAIENIIHYTSAPASYWIQWKRRHQNEYGSGENLSNTSSEEALRLCPHHVKEFFQIQNVTHTLQKWRERVVNKMIQDLKNWYDITEKLKKEEKEDARSVKEIDPLFQPEFWDDFGTKYRINAQWSFTEKNQAIHVHIHDENKEDGENKHQHQNGNFYFPLKTDLTPIKQFRQNEKNLSFYLNQFKTNTKITIEMRDNISFYKNVERMNKTVSSCATPTIFELSIKKLKLFFVLYGIYWLQKRIIGLIKEYQKAMDTNKHRRSLIITEELMMLLKSFMFIYGIMPSFSNNQKKLNKKLNADHQQITPNNFLNQRPEFISFTMGVDSPDQIARIINSKVEEIFRKHQTNR